MAILIAQPALLSQARAIRAYSPTLADAVRDGNAGARWKRLMERAAAQRVSQEGADTPAPAACACVTSAQ